MDDLTLDLLETLYQQYLLHGIDSEAAKLIQKYLISKGYDIGFIDKNTGKYRTSPDGRLGFKTLRALNLQMAVLRGSDPYEYEKEFVTPFGKFAGQTPTYNNVVGRDKELTQLMTNVYFNYYSKYPLMYAGLLLDKIQASKVLPYLSDEAKILLSYKAEQWADANGLVLNIPEMAYLGLLGSRGTELMLQWSLRNVRDALARGGNNLMQTIFGDILGAGLKVMGLLTGGDISNMGGLTKTSRFNPLTRTHQYVAVPSPTSTVWDNLPDSKDLYALDDIGHTIIQADGTLAKMHTPDILKNMTGLGVNVLTDPLSWLSAATAGDWNPGQSVSYKVAEVPGSARIGYNTNTLKGTPLWDPTIEVVTQPARTIQGKPNYVVIGNRSNKFRGKHGGINKVVATSQPTSRYIPPVTKLVPVNYVEINTSPYLEQRPSLQAYVTETTEPVYNPALRVMPAGLGKLVNYGNIDFTLDTPEGLVMYNYENVTPGRAINYVNSDTGDILESVKTANTHNPWAIQTLSGFTPLYYLGIYNKGGLIKKRF